MLVAAQIGRQEQYEKVKNWGCNKGRHAESTEKPERLKRQGTRIKRILLPVRQAYEHESHGSHEYFSLFSDKITGLQSVMERQRGGYMFLLSYFGKQNGSLTGTPPHRSQNWLAERCAVNDDGEKNGV